MWRVATLFTLSRKYYEAILTFPSACMSACLGEVRYVPYKLLQEPKWDLRFSRVLDFPHYAQGLRLRRVHLATCLSRGQACCLPLVRTKVGHTEKRFRSIPGLALPPVRTLRHDVVTASRNLRRKPKSMATRSSLKKRSFSTKNRFFPAHPDPFSSSAGRMEPAEKSMGTTNGRASKKLRVPRLCSGSPPVVFRTSGRSDPTSGPPTHVAIA